MSSNSKRNLKRRSRYQTILALTGNKSLAQRARDMKNASYNKILNEYNLEGNIERYKLPEKEDIKKVIVKSKESLKIEKEKLDLSKMDFELLKDIDLGTSKNRYKVIYNVLRSYGYTPKEAKSLKSKKLSYLNDLVSNNEVRDREDRKRRWKALSKKGKKLDKWMIDLAEQVNRDQGYDATSRYGYGVVYAFYINGGELEEYIVGLYPDSEMPDIYYGMKKYNF